LKVSSLRLLLQTYITYIVRILLLDHWAMLGLPAIIPILPLKPRTGEMVFFQVHQNLHVRKNPLGKIPSHARKAIRFNN
jgi:hypothetical protein